MSWLEVEGALLLGSTRVRLELRAEGHVAVVGPSGAGKTSLLRAIAGVGPFQGRITGMSERWHEGMRALVPAWRRGAAWVPQDARLFPHLRVRENLAFAGAPSAAVEEVAEWLGLAPLLGRAPRSLSGGEAQRVALGRALLAQPRALLLDEPFAALDPTLRARLGAELRAWCDARDIRILLVSHDRDDVGVLTSERLTLEGLRSADSSRPA